jgi:hypothetical protein
MSLLRVVVVVLPAVAGCTGNIQRSARVPHPGVPLSSGQPLQTPIELSAGLSNLTDFVKPRVGDETQAVEVPGTQMRNELRFRLGQRAQLGLIYEHGFGSTSQKPDPTQAPVGPGDVYGFGTSISYALDTNTPGLTVGTRFELTTWSVPYVEYITDSDRPSEPAIVDHGRANPRTLGLGVTPSYRRDRVTYFGGAFLRNHPTTLRKELDADVFENDGDVKSGPFNLLLHAGIEVEIQRWLSAIVVVHQDMVTNPVRYGPGVGLGLTARLGD